MLEVFFENNSMKKVVVELLRMTEQSGATGSDRSTTIQVTDTASHVSNRVVRASLTDRTQLLACECLGALGVFDADAVSFPQPRRKVLCVFVRVCLDWRARPLTLLLA